MKQSEFSVWLLFYLIITGLQCVIIIIRVRNFIASWIFLARKSLIRSVFIGLKQISRAEKKTYFLKSFYLAANHLLSAENIRTLKENITGGRYKVEPKFGRCSLFFPKFYRCTLWTPTIRKTQQLNKKN